MRITDIAAALYILDKFTPKEGKSDPKRKSGCSGCGCILWLIVIGIWIWLANCE